MFGPYQGRDLSNCGVGRLRVAINCGVLSVNSNTATTIIGMVIDIEEYLLKVCSPLQDQMALNNILTGEVVTNVNLEKLIGCINEGNIAYTKFITDRLKKKALSIHATISNIKFVSPKVILNLDSKADVKSEAIKALMFIEYGCHRGRGLHR